MGDVHWKACIVLSKLNTPILRLEKESEATKEKKTTPLCKKAVEKYRRAWHKPFLKATFQIYYSVTNESTYEYSWRNRLIFCILLPF